ncbi:MAG: sulfotransferase family protein, partial [Algiphilus sp.]
MPPPTAVTSIFSTVKTAMPNSRGATTSSLRPTCLLVLGMHRSGTSALTRVLSLLGADLPGNLMPARPSNEKGFWESLDVQQLNDELLAALSSRWDDPITVSMDQLAPARLASFHDRAARLLARDFSGSTLFALKDPRICRLFEFWRDALQAFGSDLKVIIPFRDPMDVAASLVARNSMDATKAQTLWLHHMLAAELQTRSVPRYILPYDDLLDDWKGSLAAISAQLDLSFPRSLDEAQPDVDAFLDPTLRHHHFTPADTSPAPFESLEIAEAARKTILRLARNMRDRGALHSMDKLNQRFHAAAQLFSAAQMDARRDALALADRVASQQRELDEIRSTKENSVAELEDLRSSEQRVAEDLRTAQLRHQEEVLRWQQTVNELADAVADRDARLETSQQQARDAEDKLAFEQKL